MVGSAQADLLPRATPDVGPSDAAGVDRAGSSSTGSPSVTSSRTWLHRPSGRDRRPRRARRLGRRDPARRPLRHASRERRNGPLPRRRRAASAHRRARRDGASPRARRPPDAGTDARPQRRPQHRPGVRRGAARLQSRGCAPERCSTRPAPDRPTADQGRARRRPGGQPVGRQPAEGRARQVARGGAHVCAARRPDARRRRGRQARDLPAHPGTRRRGTDRPVPLDRAARAGRASPTASSCFYRGRLVAGAATALPTSTTTRCCTRSTPARPLDPDRRPRPRTTRRRRPHDPTSVHDAAQAGRPGGVPPPSRRDLARARRRDRAPGHRARSRSSRTTRCSSSTRRSPTRRPGTGCGTPPGPRQLGRDHEPAHGVRRGRHRRLDRGARGVPPRDRRRAREHGSMADQAGTRRRRHRRRAGSGPGDVASRSRAAAPTVARGRALGRPARTRPSGSVTDADGTVAAIRDRRRRPGRGRLGCKDEVEERSGRRRILVNAAGVFGPIALIRTSTRRSGCATIMIDAVAPVPDGPRVPGRHDRCRLGAHRQHHLGGVAASARRAQQRLRARPRSPSTSSPATSPPRWPTRASPPTSSIRATSRRTCGPTSATRSPAWGPSPTAIKAWVHWVDETGGDPPAQGGRPHPAADARDAGGDTTGQFCWIDDPLQPPIPSWDAAGDARPWTTDH